jgi:HAE1 family hydrophobic/amphiphilic exporter-1
MTVFVAVVIVLVVGVISFTKMTPDLFPRMNLPYVAVLTAYPGASPEKIEQSVTKPLEETMATLEDIRFIRSESSDNVSMIFLEFESSANLESIMVEMLQRVNRATATWEDAVGTPIMLKLSPDMMPIMATAIEMEGMDAKTLSRFVRDTLENKLEGITGVASFSISGLVEEQINVALRQDKIDAANERVSAAISDKFTEQEITLIDTRSELQSGILELKKKSDELKSGLEQLSSQLGTGQAEITSNLSDLTAGKGGLQAQIMLLGRLLEQLAMLPPSPQTGAQAAQIQAAIAELGAAQQGLETAKSALVDAQAQLTASLAKGLFELNYGAAGLAIAQSQLESALKQVDAGMEQLDSARVDALEQADMRKVLTMGMISDILKAQNFAMPTGYVHEGNEDFLVRVGDEIASMEELQSLILADPGLDGVEAIRLEDVADVFISDNLDTLYSRINGNDGVLVTFNRQSVHATTEVTDNIRSTFDALSEEYPGLHFTPLMDQGEYIYIVVNSIVENLGLGAVFAIVILFLFLRSVRPTIIILCSIPFSVVFAIVLMYFSGITLNIISLSGLAIAVGMLVDNSIVVIENIFRLRSKGVPVVKAVVSGAGQVSAAITASTITTICVFAPIIFVEGITRQLFVDMVLTLAYALMASLIVALTLIPAMACGLFKTIKQKPDKAIKRTHALYSKALSWSLNHKAIMLIAVVLLLAGSTAAVMVRGFTLMPSMDQPQISLSITVPEDRGFDGLKAVSDEAMDRIMKVEGVDTIGVVAGTAAGEMNMMGLGGASGGDTTVSTFYITVKGGYSGAALIGLIEPALEDLDAEIEISAAGADVSALGGSGITVRLFGDDMDRLLEASGQVTAALGKIKGVAEIDDGIADSKSELRIIVDKDAAMKKGLTVAQVYMEVSKSLLDRQSATNITQDDVDYEVVVVKADESELTPDFIENLTFVTNLPGGGSEEVRLKDIVRVEKALSPDVISRVDQRRYIPVDITVAEASNVTLVAQDVEKAVEGLKLPSGVRYEYEGENESIMDSFKDLVLMLLLGVLLVYLVMAAQFQSLKGPFIIMFTIPLAFTGGFLALLITGFELSAVSLMGFIMLVGIIVNNGIVLVDYINQLRIGGLERRSAILEAGIERMRPILMTAATTVLGLTVMAIGVGSGAEMMQPLAIVCVGGLVYATLMTLFIVPIIYELFSKKELRVVSAEDLIVDKDI